MVLSSAKQFMSGGGFEPCKDVPLPKRDLENLHECWPLILTSELLNRLEKQLKRWISLAQSGYWRLVLTLTSVTPTLVSKYLKYIVII